VLTRLSSPAPPEKGVIPVYDGRVGASAIDECVVAVAARNAVVAVAAIDAVVVNPPVYGVRAIATLDGVVAGASLDAGADAVVTGIDRVLLIRQDQMLDLREGNRVDAVRESRRQQC
jgi:hypothetical protein